MESADTDLQSPALHVARTFWAAASTCADMSRGFRNLARQMLAKLQPL